MVPAAYAAGLFQAAHPVFSQPALSLLPGVLPPGGLGVQKGVLRGDLCSGVYSRVCDPNFGDVGSRGASGEAVRKGAATSGGGGGGCGGGVGRGESSSCSALSLASSDSAAAATAAAGGGVNGGEALRYPMYSRRVQSKSEPVALGLGAVGYSPGSGSGSGA